MRSIQLQYRLETFTGRSRFVPGDKMPFIASPNRTALFENMPQRDGQPSDGDQCDGNNRQIEPAHLFLIRLRPTDLLVTC